MKTLELENYGVAEMEHGEQNETDGGWLPSVYAIVKAVATWWAVEAANDSDAHTKAMQKGFEGGQDAAPKFNV